MSAYWKDKYGFLMHRVPSPKSIAPKALKRKWVIIPDLTGQRSNVIQFAKCWGERQENNLVPEAGGNVALIVMALWWKAFSFSSKAFDSTFQKWTPGARKMAQAMQCLLYKDEGLYFVPSAHMFKKKSGCIFVTPALWKLRWADPCSSLASCGPIYPSLSSRVS